MTAMLTSPLTMPVTGGAGFATGRQRRHGRCGVGQPDPIATTPEEYVQRAVELATDIARLRELRAGLRGRMARSPFTDGERLTRSVETAYHKMWARYCDRKQEQNGLIEGGEENGVGHA